jgi:hypothetical protein
MTPIDKAFKKAFKGQSAVAGNESFQGKHWQWPSTDPGEWSPKSLLIILHESGLPDEFQCPASKPYWDHLEKELQEIFGFEVFIESVNAAVSAVWKV